MGKKESKQREINREEEEGEEEKEEDRERGGKGVGGRERGGAERGGVGRGGGGAVTARGGPRTDGQGAGLALTMRAHAAAWAARNSCGTCHCSHNAWAQVLIGSTWASKAGSVVPVAPSAA